MNPELPKICLPWPHFIIAHNSELNQEYRALKSVQVGITGNMQVSLVGDARENVGVILSDALKYRHSIFLLFILYFILSSLRVVNSAYIEFA